MDGGEPHQQPYKFEPLESPSNIRVLELFVYNNQLECRLRQIHVMDSGYQALSYVWGSAESPFQITIRDAMENSLGYINLTANLHDALHDLWSARNVDRKIFWIDQICINQDGEEKNGQVALMHQIYAQSDRVVTYLGSAVDATEHQGCCELLLEIHRCFLRNHERYFEWASLETISIYLHTLPVMELEPEIKRKLTKQNWEWLSKVAAAEWHTRLWIVQEQLMRKSIIMLYGNQTLPWDAVVLLSVHSYVGLLSSEHFGRLERKYEQFFHAPLMLDMWHHRQRCFFRAEADSMQPNHLYSLLYNVRPTARCVPVTYETMYTPCWLYRQTGQSWSCYQTMASTTIFANFAPTSQFERCKMIVPYSHCSMSTPGRDQKTSPNLHGSLM